ncbi:stachyose synthase-like [Iris pallida]|uniref:Stachyose synthase-like n=1 Tax=Iris pallida TaxID=29817 RepID=A0AAX6DX18_IRIPA|nr:stachyose synthase-like [Iris pallida]
MHSYLSSAGITGVKVDVIQLLEVICEEYGGRVELANAYYKGLTESLIRNFNGTGMISSMQQCNDFFFLGTWQTSFGRTGDDFWFHDPNGDPMGAYWLQGLHMIHCAYNSLWMGQMILPDWDMFQSDHCCAKFHAGSRAICGGPIYVSDSVGHHDFHLIKQLVFPDGTIPKCIHFALPTRDCMFKNPLFDGETILKIWNLNKFGGVLGAFNCQGAGWDIKEHRFKGYSHLYKPVSGEVHVKDMEWGQKQETSAMGEAEEYAVYLNQSDELVLMSPESDAICITVQPSSFEIFSFVPIRRINGNDNVVKFAPIGLTNMFNGGGAICGVEWVGGGVRVTVKGGGRLLAYSSGKPRVVTVTELLRK